ncbi:hypothetical protein PILCRDRAFT_47397, partial [Piloderma croceum F 1598]
MIFAGDFAQLPPAMGKAPLYSGTVGTRTHSRMSISDQESAIGKALWHQVTIVVILRQNMRQKGITEEDIKLQTALENIGPGDPRIAQKCFRNVSIITATNAQKDKINQLGSVQFALENKQNLTAFYSIDRWKDPDRRKKKGKTRSSTSKYLPNPALNSDILKPKLQRVLWNQPHSTSNHIPGTLLLCIGLPV